MLPNINRVSANMPKNYNPDVLSCIANLSNDEVFTSPQLANQMLDLIPAHFFSDPTKTFLDPCSKSGVFLREIAKRLIKGLESHFPDLQERLNHIFTKQLFGIGITTLTAQLSRRSLYCSREANGQYSVCTAFDDENGNIFYRTLAHKWENGRCTECGASQEVFDRDDKAESHAYHFIHSYSPFFEQYNKMKFDVIIGNPPYQLNLGNNSGNKSKAKAIYHLFIEQAKALDPDYLVMIIPSRWMTVSSEGIPQSWIDEMISDKKIKVLHDFETAQQCFPGVPVEGGVCYFVRDKFYSGMCQYFFHRLNESNNDNFHMNYLDSYNLGFVIRDIEGLSILDKIKVVEGDEYFNNNSFSTLVSPKDFFTNKTHLTSKWQDYSLQKDAIYNIKYYLNKQLNPEGFGWVSIDQIPKNRPVRSLHKVYIPAAYGGKEKVLGNPFYGEPNSVCSQTYLVIGYNQNFNEQECKNIISYIHTKFFRYLVSIKKKTQNGARAVYQLVPIQDFSQSWNDEKLYAKYGLTADEIAFIESMVRPMERDDVE